VFSAIGKPKDFVVAQSLALVGSSASVYVITSKKFKKSWEGNGATVQVASSNSLALWKKRVRHLLVRSSFARRISRGIRNILPERHQAFLMPPHNARHFEYSKVLRGLDQESWTILVDSRDLIFQEKPEQIIHKLSKDFDIHLFDEGDVFFKNGIKQINGLSPANWNWALQLKNFDVDKVEKLRNHNILNSGCIIGKNSALIELIDKSCEALKSSLWSDIALLDQASLNYVAYSGEVSPRIDFHMNGELVLNMCGVIEENVINSLGVLMIDHSPIGIIHQFDRFGTWSPANGIEFTKRRYEIQ
jgi:hypothetical protein